MKRKNSIELLNSEGPILVSTKIANKFLMIDERGKIIAEWNQSEIEDFISGKITITSSEGKILRYVEFPDSMKPNIQTILKFINYC